MSSKKFKNEVFRIVSTVPNGYVMTYGQIAALAGSPRSARIVGQIAHFGPDDLPWHRVVRKDGGLASGFPGGMRVQAQLLEEDGTEVENNCVVDIATKLWWPDEL